MSFADKKFTAGLLSILCLLGLGISQAWGQAEDYNDRQHHSSFADAQKECTGSQEWNSERNMCVTTVESKERRDDVRECAEIEDDAARKACHDEIASRETGVSKGEGYSDSAGMDMAIPAVTAALSGTMMLSSKKGFGSSCKSLMVMAGTSAIGLASEFFYKKQAREKLEELQDKYKEETLVNDAYHAQKRAFEYLKEEQELIAEFEEKRRNTMYVMTGGFGAAAVMAFTVDKKVVSCGKGKEEKPEASESAQAQDSAPQAQEGAAEGAADDGFSGETEHDKLAKSSSLFGGGLSSPKVVGIASGLAAAASLKLGMEAGKQAKNAKSNAEKVQKIIDKFAADFEQFCPQGREDMSDPNCFCYNLDGTKNQDRTNSQTCQEHWAQRDKNLFAKAGDYSNRGKKRVKPQGCAFLNGNFDKDCRCKKMKNDEGKNACLKVGVPSSVAGNLSGAVPLPRILGNLNKAAEGGISTGSFNSDQLGGDARAANKAAQRVIEQALEESTGKKPPSPDELLARRVNSIPDQAVRKMNERTGNSASGAAAMMRPQTPELKEALKQAGVEEASSSDEAISYSRSGTDQRKRSNKNKDGEDDFFGDWGDSSEGGNQGQELTFMEKKYQYQQNDIVEREDISLWEIISRRYTQTGLRRLFPDEEKPLEDLN